MGLLDVDLWQLGIVRAPLAKLIDLGSLVDESIMWVPTDPSLGFLADPFGLMRDGCLHIFAEAFDYRNRVGAIDVLRFNEHLNLLDRRECCREPWHLSYPFVFEAEGETWLLPEAFRSGTVTLYRATEFPVRWSAAARFALDAPAVDPTLFRHEDRWWLAYAPGGTIAQRQGQLHLAFADAIQGPWTPHPSNPVRVDRGGARPGGTAIPYEGGIVLPVQDCSRSYGAALKFLNIRTLTPNRFAAELIGDLKPPDATPPFEGLHTASQCGPYTLIDAKRIDRSWKARTELTKGFLRNMMDAE